MDSIPSQLLIQIFLIILNAFFAATEIALLSLNAVKLRNDAEGGDKMAVKLLKLVEQPAGFLSTIQIGITLAGFLGSAFAAENFSGYLVQWIYVDLGFQALPEKALNTVAMICVTIILSYFTLIFGELVPKRIAMQKPRLVACASCQIVTIIAAVMRPVVWFLSISTNGVLRLLRLNTEAEEQDVTEEEIRMMIALGGEKGAIEEKEEEWIQNVFQFNDRTVEDVMTRKTDFITVFEEDTKETVIHTFVEHGHSRLPVLDQSGRDVVGILNIKGFLIQENSQEKEAWQSLIKQPYFVPDTLSANQLFQDMQKQKEHMAVVVDEYGEIVGLITMEDLLEEIVGSIYDEFDKTEKPEIEQLSENRWKVSGALELEKLKEELSLTFSEEPRCETVGGLVYQKLRRIPENGVPAAVESHGLRIRVVHMKNQRIIEAIVEKLPA